MISSESTTAAADALDAQRSAKELLSRAQALLKLDNELTDDLGGKLETPATSEAERTRAQALLKLDNELTDDLGGKLETPATSEADRVDTVHTPVEQAVELRDLGNDQVPWNAIMHSIQNNSRLDVDNINGTTNVIKNLYRALNANAEVGVIGMDSTFAIPYQLGGELPEGAVGWFFSENQIENLAPQIDEAINAFNRGEELTEIQELMINLNSSNDVVAKTIDELNNNSELFQQFMDIANEG